jgi:hypothetical protein
MTAHARTLRRAAPLLALLAALGCARAPALGAQQPAAHTAASITGRVLDGATGAPLADASVVLEPGGGGALPPDPRGGPAMFAAGRSARSGPDGGYGFAALPPGLYRLRVSRAGYHPATLTVELHSTSPALVSVGMTVEPVMLEPLEVVGRRAPAAGEVFARSPDFAREVEEGSLPALRALRERFPATDAREMTEAQVQEAVTYAEPDVLRALLRLPGASAAGGHSAELWTRGAPASHTRVLFDGIPLVAPLHLGGAMSSVGPDAVGAAAFYPGVRPPSLGDGAAGVVELLSRRGGRGRPLSALGELTVASGRLAVEGETPGGRVAWLGAGRSTLGPAPAGELGLGEGAEYTFYDLAGRLDVDLGGGRALEVSALRTGDAVSDTLHAELLGRTYVSWENAGARATLALPAGPLRLRHTVGASRYRAAVEKGLFGREGFTVPSNLPWISTIAGLGDRVETGFLRGEAAPAGGPSTAVARWTGGYEVARQRAVTDSVPSIWQGEGEGRLPTHMVLVPRARELVVAAAWGEYRWTPSPRLFLSAGLRVEGGGRVAGLPALRPAPRASLRWEALPELALSAGAGRVFQYLQNVPQAVFGSRWLVAGADAPALRADLATAGAELWLGREWLATANVFARRTEGMVAMSRVRDEDFSGYATPGTENRASGTEVGVRRLAGRWTASAAYTRLRSGLRAPGEARAAEEDQRHTVDATGLLRVSRAFRVGGAFTLATGDPFPYRRACRGECAAASPEVGRRPVFRSLDAMADWSGRAGPLELGAFVQLRNVLGTPNPGPYVEPECTGGGDTPQRCGPLLAGGPVSLLLAGVRARF